MTDNAFLSLVPGEELPEREAVPAPSARATVAASPTLAVVGGQPGQARGVAVPERPAPTARAAETTTAEPDAAIEAPAAPARALAQQGAQVAQPPPKFKLPPVDEMVADYQRWQMMASDPEVAKEVKPRMDAWKNLTMQQHAQAFPGDPMASPDQAAAYARHMGQISGRLGAPMSWDEASRIAEYTEGRKAQLPTQFMEGMKRYDQALVQPLVDDVFGDGWEMVSLAPGKTTVGGTEMEVPTLTVRDKASGATKALTPIDVSAVFGNMEGKLKYAKENREQTMKGLLADLEQAKARQDPEAAYQAWEKMQELQGGTGGFGGGKPAGAGAMGYLPKVQQVLQATQSPLDPLFVMSILNAESSGNPKAVSPAGAVGLMQLMPATAKRFGVTDRTNEDQSILGGIKYLNLLHEMFDGDLRKVAAAYNAGEGAVQKHGGVPPYQETQGYVKKVLGTYRTHKATPGDDPKSIGQRLIGAPVAATGGAGGAARGAAPGTAAAPVDAAQAKALENLEKRLDKMYAKVAGDGPGMDNVRKFEMEERRKLGLGGGSSGAAQVGLGNDWEPTPAASGDSPPGTGSLPLPRGFAEQGSGAAANPPAAETGESVLKSQAAMVEKEQTTLAKTKSDTEANQALWDQVQALGGKYDPGLFGRRREPVKVDEAKQDLEFLVAQYASLKPKQQETVKQYLRKIVIQFPELRPK